MKVIELRLARLERGASRERPASYAVTVSVDAIGNDEAIRAAIAEHRRRTGYAGAVLVVPQSMTETEWLARHGHAGAL